MNDRWLEVTLPVPADKLDGVCAVLTYNGMTGLVVEEEVPSGGGGEGGCGK